MSTFDPSAYGPVCTALLLPPRLAPLDAGKPNAEVQAQLAALSAAELFPGLHVQDQKMAAACRAGLFLYHDCLDESHTISQDIDTPTGSYWHGILHRREPDAANAAYWFRRVGKHPIFDKLTEEATALGLCITSGQWDPFSFIEACESCRNTRTPDEQVLRYLQLREWELLFDFSYGAALESL
jgi:hypothetical protein